MKISFPFESVATIRGNLSNSSFKDVKIENTNLQSSGICEVKFKNIEFEECNLNKCQLFRTKLKNIDFSTCDINGIIVDASDLKGVIVNEFQALELSKLLGLKIKY